MFHWESLTCEKKATLPPTHVLCYIILCWYRFYKELFSRMMNFIKMNIFYFLPLEIGLIASLKEVEIRFRVLLVIRLFHNNSMCYLYACFMVCCFITSHMTILLVI